MFQIADYWSEGFLTVQHAIDIGIIAAATGYNATDFPEIFDTDVQLQLYPFPAYTQNFFIQVIQGQLPSILMISFIMSVLYIARNVALEKENRLKVNRFSFYLLSDLGIIHNSQGKCDRISGKSV